MGDRVASLQERRDRIVAELGFKIRELESAQCNFQLEEDNHRSCTLNCSVRRAAKFFERRQIHEMHVEAQITMLKSLEQRFLKAKKHARAIRDAEKEAMFVPPQMFQCPQDLPGMSSSSFMCTGAEAVPVPPLSCDRPPDLQGISLGSFELAGAEPSADEFLSCSSEESEESPE